MERKMKLALYIRTSRIDLNPENQRIALEQYAKAMSYEYDIFEEIESTRKTRPIKERVLNLLRKKKYDGVLVWALDRWGRTTSEMILDMEEFVKKKIKFISYKDNIDISTTSGQFMFTILSAFANMERERIRERTLAGLERAKREGKKLGRPKGSKDKGYRKKGGYYLRWKK